MAVFGVVPVAATVQCRMFWLAHAGTTALICRGAVNGRSVLWCGVEVCSTPFNGEEGMDDGFLL